MYIHKSKSSNTWYKSAKKIKWYTITQHHRTTVFFQKKYKILPQYNIITQEEEGDERANNGGEKEGKCMHASMQ